MTAAPLTRADIAGRKMAEAVHVDFSRSESAWMGKVEGVPRLGIVKGHGKTGSYTHWYIDDERCRDLDAALAVLNGTMTLEDAMPQPEPPAPKPKVSIDAQIEEVAYELDQRAKTYPGIARSNPRRKSELELHVTRMEVVKRTLEWVRDHRADLIAKPAAPAGDLLAAVGQISDALRARGLVLVQNSADGRYSIEADEVQKPYEREPKE